MTKDLENNEGISSYKEYLDKIPDSDKEFKDLVIKELRNKIKQISRKNKENKELEIRPLTDKEVDILNKKSKLLKILEEIPFVTTACKKLGIAKSTFYRWVADDASFRSYVRISRTKGRLNVGDMVESKLMQGIQNGDSRLIMFYLKHNNSRYADRIIYDDYEDLDNPNDPRVKIKSRLK